MGRVDCRRNVVVVGSGGRRRRGIGGIGSEGTETLVKDEAKWELIDDNMSISNDCHFWPCKKDLERKSSCWNLN